jgi:hypothetical protein
VVRSRVLTIVTSWIRLIVMLVSARHSMGQRSDFLALVVDEVHALSLLCDLSSQKHLYFLLIVQPISLAPGSLSLCSSHKVLLQSPFRCLLSLPSA